MKIDLSPGRPGPDLIDAIWAARRADRTDLRADLVRLLEHEDPVVREEVVSLLFVRWNDATLRDRLVRLVRADPDFGVRSRAVGALAGLAGSGGEDAGLIREVLFDPDEDPVVRKSCYEALYRIRHGTMVEVGDEADVEALLAEDWLKELR
jgi:HEAT repeat protein